MSLLEATVNMYHLVIQVSLRAWKRELVIGPMLTTYSPEEPSTWTHFLTVVVRFYRKP